MKILGQVVSDKAAGIISDIENQLSKPVIYEFTDSSKTSVYGQSDPYQTKAYYVRSKESLTYITKSNMVNIPFETNIIHELSHLCQIEEGFPYTSTLSNSITNRNIESYNILGSVVVSLILDLNVDYRLKNNGYTSEYFYKERLRKAKKAAKEWGAITNSYDFVFMAFQLVGIRLLSPREEALGALNLYKDANPGLVNCVEELSSKINEIGYNDASSAFECLVYIFNKINLWSTFSIFYKNVNYISTEAVLKDYPDIHI
nr:MAG TPA: hypothetical protein [Caudoviricetes sp.]